MRNALHRAAHLTGNLGWVKAGDLVQFRQIKIHTPRHGEDRYLYYQGKIESLYWLGENRRAAVILEGEYFPWHVDVDDIAGWTSP